MRAMFVAGLFVAGCAGIDETPGMVAQSPRVAADPALEEVAHLPLDAGERAMLVVYPRTACAGSARMVFVDRRGKFLGAVAPGQAALLAIPTSTRELLVFSSVEVSAMKGSWHRVEAVAVPPAPSGILFEAMRFSARECMSGQYATASKATKTELETAIAENEIRWYSTKLDEGQAWLDAHRARVDELVGETASHHRLVRRASNP